VPGRVGSRRHFERLARTAHRGRGISLRVQYTDQSDSPEEVAVAFAISRRVGRAVARNRVRRRLRALMDELSPSQVPGSYLITCNIRAVAMSYDELRDDLRTALGRAGTNR
jgi:ribonuclease P protein component